MTNETVLKEIDGEPARFIGSPTGKQDAEKVLLRVGAKERVVSGQEWATAPTWSGEWPEWAGKNSRKPGWLARERTGAGIRNSMTHG